MLRFETSLKQITLYFASLEELKIPGKVLEKRFTFLLCFVDGDALYQKHSLDGSHWKDDEAVGLDAISIQSDALT